MKRFFVLLLALACLLTLAACSCDHKWSKADCTTPKTCKICGEKEGEALGHEWKDADCITPKTCTWCDATDGEALGHDWQEVTCATPKTCKTCGVTEGETLEHTWQEATTEAPKTCVNCGATEGERIITDPRFTTASTQSLYGKWQGQSVITGKDMAVEGFNGELIYTVEITFGKAGETATKYVILNGQEFSNSLTSYLIEVMYAEFTNQGLTKEDADTAMVGYYGVDVATYCATVVETLGINTMFDHLNGAGVYYVADGKLYLGSSWNSELSGSAFTLSGDKLTIVNMALTNGSTLELTKVAE